MKRSLLLLLLMALFAPLAMNAQETLTVYESETGTNNYIPIYGLWADANQQSEFIIPATELEDLANGTITQMTFHLSSKASTLWNGTAQVYLREVSETAFSTMSYYGLSGSELVYNGALDAYTTNDMVVPFNSTYTYGGGNLLVGFIWTTGGNYGSAYFYGKTDATNASISHYSSYSPSAKNFIPRTTFTYTPGAAPTCVKPTNVVVSYEGSLATATWDGETSLYNIDVNGTVTNGVTSPYTFTVEPQTTYSVKVQADCGGDLSNWASAPSFTTPCAAFALPYEYGFEDAGDMECWSMVDCAGSTGRTTTASYVHEGSAAFCFSYNTNPPQYLISPMFEGTETGLGVSFYYMNPSSSYTETFQVGYSTTTNDPSDFTWGTEITASNANANTWFYYEDAFPAGAKFVAVKLNSYDQLRLCLDDFTFEVPSSCRKPTNLAASEIGPRTATLSWTENGEATAWNLLVNDQLIENVTNPYTLTGLAPETKYTVQVSPVCEVEKWSDAISFTTEVACPAPVLTIVESTPLATTFSWTGEAQGYEMEYMINSNTTFNFDDGTLQGWTNLMVIDTGGMWKHSNESPGGYDYTTLAHSGTGFALCYSFIDYDGAYNTDAYLISPRSYQINNGASMTFWYDMANDDYPEDFEVCVATVANPTANDFTPIWTSASKGSKGEKAAVRHRNTRYENWREATIDLGDYVGLTIWIAFHDVNLDAYEVWIDDVMINDGNEQWTPAPAPIASPYTLALEPETEYIVRVRAICGGEDGESAWTTVTFTTPSNCDAPFDLNVTNLMPTTATLNWTGYQDGYEVWYRPAAQGSVLLEDSFENGLDNWTTIDADGDGNNWDLRSTFGFNGTPHTGSDMVVSMSYYSTALTPDNYLVSPQVELGGSITFWAAAQDASYPAEVFGVAVSTTSNTDASAFTTIQQWTMTAKGAGASPATSRSGNRTMGTWYEYTVDLSDYAGQTGYVAIRHFDCTDMFYLDVDDITINGPATEEQEWIMASTDATSLDIEDLRPNTTYEWQVRGEDRTCGEDGTAWSEMGTFTTPNACDLPVDLVAEAEATSATLSWTGYQESYNVTYYTPATGNILIETGVGFNGYADWTAVTEDEETNFYYLSSDHSYVGFGFSSTSTPQYLISPEFDALEGNSFVEFMYYATGTEEDELFPETFKIGYSTTDAEVASFTWGELYTVSDMDYMDVDLPAGAKYFAIQYESDHAADSTMLFFLDFTVVSNYSPAGTPTTLTNVTSPVTITGLTPETLYRWDLTGISDECGELATVSSYFTTPAQTNVTQTTELAKGWNWFSTYIVGRPTDLLQMLETSLGENGTVIKSKAISTDYYEDYGWYGDLDDEGLMSDQMYMIETSAACTVELEGMPINTAEVEITINHGWNWIGFPSAEPMSVADAFAGFQAADGDILKNKAVSTDYYEDFGWYGELETMEPGQGFMYYSNSQESKTLVLGSKSKAIRSNVGNVLNLKKHLLKKLEIQKAKPIKK